MDIETDKPQGLPCDLRGDIGKILEAEQECPGVWYVVAAGNLAAEEYYIVERSVEYISEEAKAYGSSPPHHSELLAYRIDDHRSGAGIIRYEILRYHVQNGLPLPEGESLLSAALFGREDYPEYFGRFPAPLVTPHGFTVRYRELAHGVFSVETDQCEKLLAVCYPLWAACLPEPLKRLAERTAFDRRHGIENTLGYSFFSENAAQLAVAELTDCGIIDN